MQLSEAFDQYRQDVIIFGNQSRKTEESHEIAKRALVLFLGDIDISELSFTMVRDWKQHLDKGRSPLTVRAYIIKLRVVLAYFKKSGYDVMEPELINLPKRVAQVPSHASSQEVASFMGCTGKLKSKAMISLLYASGLRVSELCALNKSDYKESFTVVGKGGKARLCFMDQRSLVLISLYLEKRSDNNPALFLSDYGVRITPGVIQEVFKSIRKSKPFREQNLPPIHPHTLRHSFATNLLKSNCNLFYVQRLLGHSSLQTTQQYLHCVDEDLRSIYQKHHTF